MSNKSREEDMQQYISDLVTWLENHDYSPPQPPDWGSNNSDSEINQNISKNGNWFISALKPYLDENYPTSDDPKTSPPMTLDDKVVRYVSASGDYVVFYFQNWSSTGKSTSDALTVIEEHAHKISGHPDSYLNKYSIYPESDSPPVPPPVGGP